MLYNTRSWSAGDIIPEESDQQDVIENWISISRSIYSRENVWTRCDITLDPDQQETFTQDKLAQHDFIWSVGDIYQNNRDSMMIYETGSR